MGKSVRKYRKNRDYDYIAPEKASAYDIHDGKGTARTRGDHNDLLSSPREFVPLEELAPGESTALQVVMLLVAGSVGSTVVVLPFVFLEGGFLMTIFMVLFFSLASYLASICIVQLGVANGIYSLQGLAMLAFGTRGAHAVGVIQMALSCGLILAYLAIIFQDFPVLLGHLLHLDFDADGWPKESTTKYVTVSKILANRTLFAELFGFIILIPFCLFVHSHRKIQNFAVVSTFLLLLTSLCVVGKAKYFHDENVAAASQGFERDYMEVPKTVCQAFGVLAAQFACQHHTFHAFYAMKDRSIDRFARLSLVACLMATYLAYSFGIGGYVSFLSDSKTDMAGNQDFSSKQGTLPFWLLVPVCALFCIPLEVVSSRYAAMFMCRARSQHHLGQEEVLFRAQPAIRSQQYTTSTTPPGSHSSTSSFESKMVDHRHEGVVSTSGYTRVQIVVTFLVLAILVQIVAFPSSINIATLLSVTGGIAGIALLLVVPAACYLKLAPPHDDSHRPADSWLFAKCLPWSSIGIGLAASIASQFHSLKPSTSAGKVRLFARAHARRPSERGRWRRAHDRDRLHAGALLQRRACGALEAGQAVGQCRYYDAGLDHLCLCGQAPHGDPGAAVCDHVQRVLLQRAHAATARIKALKVNHRIYSSELELVDKLMCAFLEDSNVTDAVDLWCGRMLRLQKSTRPRCICKYGP